MSFLPLNVGRQQTMKPNRQLPSRLLLAALLLLVGLLRREACAVASSGTPVDESYTARAWQADFEWHAHVGPARSAGIPDAVIEAVRRGAEPALEDAKSRAVYTVARELHETRALSDDTYARAEAALGRQGLVDLIGILGYYTLVSMTLKTFAVSAPDRASPFED